MRKANIVPDPNHKILSFLFLMLEDRSTIPMTNPQQKPETPVEAWFVVPVVPYIPSVLQVEDAEVQTSPSVML
jgi:hypothetical protein